MISDAVDLQTDCDCVHQIWRELFHALFNYFTFRKLNIAVDRHMDCLEITILIVAYAVAVSGRKSVPIGQLVRRLSSISHFGDFGWYFPIPSGFEIVLRAQ